MFFSFSSKKNLRIFNNADKNARIFPYLPIARYFSTKIFFFLHQKKVNTNNLFFFSSKIRKTKKVSVFPVGLLSGRPVSTPVVKNGEIVDFYEGWIGGREFPIDMAGFAFTVKVLKDVKRSNNQFEIIVSISQ